MSFQNLSGPALAVAVIVLVAIALLGGISLAFKGNVQF